MPEPKLCFVIAPIGEPDSDTRKRSDQILQHVITPAVSQVGYEPIRADQIDKPGLITNQVIQHIVSDPLVVADLTEHNPNVFYELAIRHALRLPLVQIISMGDPIPFDVASARTIKVNHTDLDSVANAKDEIVEQIRALEADPLGFDTPISAALNLLQLRQSEKPQGPRMPISKDIRKWAWLCGFYLPHLALAMKHGDDDLYKQTRENLDEITIEAGVALKLPEELSELRRQSISVYRIERGLYHEFLKYDKTLAETVTFAYKIGMMGFGPDNPKWTKADTAEMMAALEAQVQRAGEDFERYRDIVGLYLNGEETGGDMVNRVSRVFFESAEKGHLASD